LWQDPHVTHALVRLQPGEDIEAVRERIGRAIGRRYHVRVLRIDELVAWFSEQVRRAFAGLNVLAALALVVVMVGVGDTLAAGTIERTRELGIVRAIGLRRRALGLVVAGEALIIGLLGVFLAIAFGLGLGLLWVVWTFPALLGWTLSLHLPWIETVELCVA